MIRAIILMTWLCVVTHVECGDESCALKFKKIGCFTQYQVPMNAMSMVANLRGEIPWMKVAKMKAFYQSLVCKCATLARKANKYHFSIRFYGECFIGNDHIHLTEAKHNHKLQSKSCKTYKSTPCNDNDDVPCVGIAHVDFIYELQKDIEAEKKCGKGMALAADEKTCTDWDECKGTDHGCQQHCHNTLGSYYCTCNDHKYILGADKKKCEDKNECLINNGGCNHVCVNTDGSYHCKCKQATGYGMLADKKTCQDINECRASNAGGCEHVCVNTEGAYKCSCHAGYALAQNKQNCEDVDECQLSTHGCQQDCINKRGGYECSCRSGYEVGDIDKKTCKDVNECDHSNNGGCDHICINNVGSFVCQCKPGYKRNADKRTCKAICGAGEEFTGTKCEKV